MTITNSGTQDYRKDLSFSAWSFCYANMACRSPPLYPSEFEVAALAVLREDLQMVKDDINLNNANMVYVHLLNSFTE